MDRKGIESKQRSAPFLAEGVQRKLKQLKPFVELSRRNLTTVANATALFTKINRSVRQRPDKSPWILLSASADKQYAVVGRMVRPEDKVTVYNLEVVTVDRANLVRAREHPDAGGLKYLESEPYVESNYEAIADDHTHYDEIGRLGAEFTSRRRFSPIHALHRAGVARKIEDRLDSYDDLLTAFNEAAHSPELNPRLAVGIGHRAGQQTTEVVLERRLAR